MSFSNNITTTEIKAIRAWTENGQVCVRLADGREVRFPIASNRRLRSGTPAQVANMELICDGAGLHWTDLDEDLSIKGILEGRLGPA